MGTELGRTAAARTILDRVLVVADEKSKDRLLGSLAGSRRSVAVVSWVNAHTLQTACRNPDLHEHMVNANLLLRDGIGISILMKLSGRRPGLNVNGTDLIPEIIRLNRFRPVALLGTAEPYLSRAAAKIEGEGGMVVLRMDGFQSPETYLRRLVETRPRVIVLGMGVPKQDEVAAFLQANYPHPALVLNGGAILDFIAGRFPRAPLLWRSLRLEWMFRLIQEPRRLWRRYLLGGARFALDLTPLVWALRKRPG